MIFNLFASLAEFERDLIRERTYAGLSAARARGRVGGRPKGLDAQAEATAMAAETLYREGRLSVNAIADKLHISKSTLYSYLRHRGVEIGAYQKVVTNTRESQSAEQVADITLRLTIENNSQFVRGKKRARENIERYCLDQYHATRLSSGDYALRINYKNREELDVLMADLLRDMSHEAEMRHCYIEAGGGLAKKSGFSNIGMDALAAAAGVTTGAFYSQFRSKTEFLHAIVEHELSAIVKVFEGKSGKGLERTIGWYLGQNHASHPETGCQIPALGAEIGRADDSTKKIFEELTSKMVTALEVGTADRSKAWALLAQSVGGIILARAVLSNLWVKAF